jgi:hypothetical protein
MSGSKQEGSTLRNQLKEKIMKKLRKSWKLITLFAFGAIACLLYVGRANGTGATPNIVISYGSSILGPNQLANLAITNTTAETISPTVNVCSTSQTLIGSPMPLSIPAFGTGSVQITTPLVTITQPDGSTTSAQQDFLVNIVYPPLAGLTAQQAEGALISNIDIVEFASEVGLPVDTTATLLAAIVGRTSPTSNPCAVPLIGSSSIPQSGAGTGDNIVIPFAATQMGPFQFSTIELTNTTAVDLSASIAVCDSFDNEIIGLGSVDITIPPGGTSTQQITTPEVTIPLPGNSFGLAQQLYRLNVAYTPPSFLSATQATGALKVNMNINSAANATFPFIFAGDKTPFTTPRFFPSGSNPCNIPTL